KLTTSTSTQAAAQMVYGALVTIDPVLLKPLMGLAKSLTASPDSKVWTIKLRAGLKFSDGTPLDAAAGVATWDRHKIAGLGSPCLTAVAGLSSYVAQDPTTLVVTLPEARVAFPTQLAGCLTYVESPTAVAKYGANTGSTPESTVGAGPF